MRFILDTQIVIWWNTESSRLSEEVRTIIKDTSNEKLISYATLWEMAIKIKIGKLTILPDLPTFVEKNIKKNGMTLLPIDEHSIYATGKLGLYHQDPFDRLIIAQSVVENTPVISTDSTWKRYPIHVIS